MRVRLRKGVRLRQDLFGGICYVAHRDDFFAANTGVFDVVAKLTSQWTEVTMEWHQTYSALAQLGICETLDPETKEHSYSGPSFLGEFLEIPTVSEPLVLNCFSTAHCPLKCVYCHADDLMQKYRQTEVDEDLDNVIATARSIPSMVAVITGGDPLTRPERARRLIAGLSGLKSLILDSSGVGDIGILMSTLKEHDVHVRVSVDTVDPGIHGRLRPINPNYVPVGTSSLDSALTTIEKCIQNGIDVTVQTVLSARNENEDQWADLRDKLIETGVKHWVLHLAVKAGAARRLETKAKGGKGKAILPSLEIHDKLWRFVKSSSSQSMNIDIRCTDTSTSPNSVLLVGSRGDLFTEGYAHQGKVELYKANKGRPDLVFALWPHLDRFGHARRYLNWNPWFFDGRSLERICFPVPLPSPAATEIRSKTVVETEVKHRVRDLPLLTRLLKTNGYIPGETVLQRDEYYDDSGDNLSSLDYVVRVRRENDSCIVGLKGPRFYANGGEYSRVELEFEARDEEKLARELSTRGLQLTWLFEKRRTHYKRQGSTLSVAIDEIPEIGHFLEVEGTLEDVNRFIPWVVDSLETSPERRNYKELFVAHKEAQGVAKDLVQGASFEHDAGL